MNVFRGIGADKRQESLSRRLESNSSASIIFCQELPGHFRRLANAAGYCFVRAGSQAAVMWRSKGSNEKQHHNQSDATTFQALLSEKDLLPGVSMVKITTRKKPRRSTLAVSYDGQLDSSNTEVLKTFLNKVIKKNKITSYIIGADFDFDALADKIPNEQSKVSYKSSRDYYFRHIAEEKFEQWVRVIHLENQKTPNIDKEKKNSNVAHGEPATQSAEPTFAQADVEGSPRKENTNLGKSTRKSENFHFQPVDLSWKKRKLEEIIGEKFKGEQQNPRAYEILLGNKEPTSVQIIEGDGNCLFRAVSYVMSGSQYHHYILRKLAVEQIYDMGPKFKKISTEESPQEYIKRTKMNKLSCWGTDVEIYALSALLDTCIFVFYPLNKSWNKFDYKTLEVSTLTSSQSESIYLQNTNLDHFDVVLDIE